MQVFGEVREKYDYFAAWAADSPCFVEWARGVVSDPEVLAWIGTLPDPKQQPNLVFAAARWHGVPAPGPYDALRTALLADDEGGGAIRATIMSRSTQTNEVGRLATLVPAMSLVEQQHGPLALVEIGASAGLCQYPDRWDYQWSTGALTGSGGGVLTCRTDGPVPMPTSHPRIAHRVGVDLNPLDVTDPDAMAWLETLVWPEEDARRARLRQAVEGARQDPPHLERGDLLTEVPRLVEEAGRHGVPLVFHTAVIAYLDDEQRGRFRSMMADLVGQGRCHWISNESPKVLPDLAERPEEGGGQFAMALDGRQLAWTHGHGSSMTWITGGTPGPDGAF